MCSRVTRKTPRHEGCLEWCRTFSSAMGPLVIAVIRFSRIGFCVGLACKACCLRTTNRAAHFAIGSVFVAGTAGKTLSFASPTTKFAKDNRHEISSPNCWPSRFLSPKSPPGGVGGHLSGCDGHAKTASAYSRSLFFWPPNLVTTVACEQVSDMILGHVLAVLDGR